MFGSASLKVERAKHHIADLERQFEAFVLRKPHRFSIKHDPESGQPVIQIRFVEDVPEGLSVVIGDAIHNLRSALDHAVWEIVGWDGGTQDKYLSFVCGNDRANHVSRCKGIKTPSAWITDLFLGFEAFPGGDGEVFCLLHDMDIADKHRAIQPVLRATTHPAFQIYHANGAPFIRMQGNRFIGGNGDTFQIAAVPPGGSVELDNDANCTPSIFFPDIRGGDVFDTLKAFTGGVVNAIERFQAAVAQNPKS